jgi:hypothetical protein
MTVKQLRENLANLDDDCIVVIHCDITPKLNSYYYSVETACYQDEHNEQPSNLFIVIADKELDM